jgi:bifunctional non-homologous end joining protein LigD
MKSGEKDWLFIKEYDDQADESRGTDDYPMNSVFSGLSLDDLDAGRNPKTSVLRSISRANIGPVHEAPQHQTPMLAPMLAKTGKPFNREGWVFEIKYDGYRLICIKNADSTRLMSRNGNDLSLTFPDIVQAVSRLPYSDIVLDGEAVVHDAAGLPSFARMQKRGRMTQPSQIAHAMRANPATLYAFDLLSFENHDLRDLTLIKRKSYLEKLLPESGIIKYSSHIPKDGMAMYQAAEGLGLEGIVGKKADSKYRSGRSDNWIKVRVDQTDDFVIMGYRKKQNDDIRSIMVGQYIDGRLTYSGNVGSGFSEKMSRELSQKFAKLRTIKQPKNTPEGEDLIWKQARLVCEVRFKEFTPAGQLRHPVILHIRDDKDPKECTRDSISHELAEVKVEPEAIVKTVHLSNLDKLFWPDDGYTKGDMIQYYKAVSPWLLPWLKDRPLVLTRYPDGINGKSFFQKDAPAFAPDWMRIEKTWSESTDREIGYFVADCEEAIVYIANMASIPLHIQHSRTTDLEQPDWCVLDLDPKEAPFKDVIKVAKAIHSLCDEIGMPNFVKTSGSTGLHILLPLNNQFTFEQSRIMGELLGRVIVAELPDICTMVRNPAKREGKVYIDYLQNGSGKLIASTYCVRPLPGAPVSMPICWNEVNAKLRPDSYTIKNSIKRLKRLKTDPAIAVLTTQVDLLSVLEALTGKFAELKSPSTTIC